MTVKTNHAQPENLAIRVMNEGDLSLCRSLVAMAGWNQLDYDWHRAMKLEPDGCFVATIGGRVSQPLPAAGLDL